MTEQVRYEIDGDIVAIILEFAAEDDPPFTTQNEARLSAFQRAEDIYRFRRRREAAFPDGLFHDPCWDILLDLYVQEARGRTVSITSACHAAAVAPTTALRNLRLLIEIGLVEREPMAGDRRKHAVTLSDSCRRRIDRLFAPPTGIPAPQPDERRPAIAAADRLQLRVAPTA